MAAQPAPYYDDGTVVIYNNDCREVLPFLSGIDLVLTSPPYNLSGDGVSPSGTYFKNLSEGYGAHTDAMPAADYEAWQHDVLRACWATLSDTGAIFYNHKPRVIGNQATFPLRLVPPELPVRQVVIWDRLSGLNRQFTYFVPAHEWIVMICKPDFRLTTRSVDDVWRIPFETGSEHPAPFPLKLASRAINSTPAQVVLDPFAGSGTTLRAAKDAGRKAIGIELEERFCELAVRRLGQSSLFEGIA